MRSALIVAISILMLCCAGHVGNVLKKSQMTVNSTNVSAVEVFELDVRNPEYVDSVAYTMRVVKAGEDVKITFLNYTYSTTSSYQLSVHRKMRMALKGAWIIDRGSEFYLYTPNLLYMRDRVCVYRTANGLPRYRGLPIITFIDVARYFNKAKDVSVRDEGRYYLATYTLEYPYVRFAERAEFSVWISKSTLIPVKVRIRAKYDGSDITMRIKVLSYRTGSVTGNFSLKGLKVIRRYP